MQLRRQSFGAVFGAFRDPHLALCDHQETVGVVALADDDLAVFELENPDGEVDLTQLLFVGALKDWDAVA